MVVNLVDAEASPLMSVFPFLFHSLFLSLSCVFSLLLWLPVQTVQWMKGTKDLTNSPRTVKEVHADYIRFSIKEAVVADEGAYFIVARNRHGIDRSFTKVSVRAREMPWFGRRTPPGRINELFTPFFFFSPRRSSHRGATRSTWRTILIGMHPTRAGNKCMQSTALKLYTCR